MHGTYFNDFLHRNNKKEKKINHNNVLIPPPQTIHLPFFKTNASKQLSTLLLFLLLLLFTFMVWIQYFQALLDYLQKKKKFQKKNFLVSFPRETKLKAILKTVCPSPQRKWKQLSVRHFARKVLFRNSSTMWDNGFLPQLWRIGILKSETFTFYLGETLCMCFLYSFS